MSKNIHKIVDFLAKRQGFEDFKDLARRGLDIHPSTFSSNLNKIKTLEDLDSAFVRELADRLGVKIQQFKNVIEDNQSFDPNAHRLLVEQKVKEFSVFHEKYAAEILDLTNRLHQGDSYNLITCYRPYEYDDRKLRAAIGNAIQTGVNFNYIFPSESLYKYLEIYRTPDLQEFDRLIKGLENYKKKLVAEGIDEEIVNDKINYYECEDPFLISPLMKLIYLNRRIFGVSEEVVFAEARIGNINNFSVQKLWYPLPRYEVDNIVTQIAYLF